MSVGDGTRPGSDPAHNYPGWDYIQAKGPGWQNIRKSEREVMRWEGEINQALAKVDKAVTALRVAFIFLHGGHVDRGAMAKSGLNPDMEPAQVLNHVMGLLPKDIPALVAKK